MYNQLVDELHLFILVDVHSYMATFKHTVKDTALLFDYATREPVFQGCTIVIAYVDMYVCADRVDNVSLNGLIQN